MHRIPVYLFSLFLLLGAASSESGATSSPPTWTVDMVDQSGTAQFTSMKIDTAGNVHIAYVATDGGKFSLKYAFWDRSIKKWFTMQVAERASFCSLALDSKQHPHISFADRGTMWGDKLRHAYWDDQELKWVVQAIPLAADTIAYYTSIVLDKNDRPAISFYEYDGPRNSGLRVRMRVVRLTENGWEAQTVDGRNQSGKFNSLAIDSLGRLHLGYANVKEDTAGARYGFFDGQQWKLEIVEQLSSTQRAYLGHSMAIAVDKDNDPHMTYVHYSPPYYIKYAVRKNDKWNISIVDQVALVDYPDRNSILLDSDGQPWIGYYDKRNGILKLAHREGSKWFAEIVDGHRSGYTSSIAIDRGMVWVSYSDEAGTGLRVARRPLAPSTTGGTAATAAAAAKTDPSSR
jgi:hypothetical protein